MKDVKMTLKYLGLIYLFIIFSIPFISNLVPDVFPFLNVSSVYLIFLSLVLIYYYNRIIVPHAGLRLSMLSIAGLIFLLLLFRGLKYAVFSEVDVIRRHIWYLYYLPMLLIPTFMYYISIHCFKKEDVWFTRRWVVTFLISVLTFLLILSNDLHQQAFRFRPGFENWDSDYSYGWVFYIAAFIQYGLGVFSILCILVKSRIRGVQKHSWLLLIPFVTGLAVILLLISGHMPTINGSYPIQFPEAYCLMIVGVLECCLQLGLIPSNQNHRTIFNLASINAQITDNDGTPIYISKDAISLSPEEFALEDGARLKEHCIFRKVPLDGGFGIWLEDVTELDELNHALRNTEKKLTEETELLRLQNELKEKELKAVRRSELYDIIAKKTVYQSQRISQIAKNLQNSEDEKEEEAGCRKITLLATFIKRYSNLMLLSEEKSDIPIGELALSVSEVLRRMNRCDIPAEILNNASGMASAEAVISAFEVFGILLKNHIENLQGRYIVLSDKEDGYNMKMTLDAAGASFYPEALNEMSLSGLQIDSEQEDNVSYFTIHLQGRGHFDEIC